MMAAGGSDIAPDWGTWQEEIHCPRCGYDLRMLVEPRCPECGLRSTWRELTERTIYEDRTGLFEYWWRRRPIRSLVSTLWRCMFPWLLWPRIPLVAEPRIGPLLVLVLLTLLVCIAANVLVDGGWTLWYFSRGGTVFASDWFGIRPTLRRGGRFGGAAALLMLLIGAMTLAAMLVFRQSMSRHRARVIHVVRIGVLAWVGLVIWTSLLSTVPYVRVTCGLRFGARLDARILDGRDLLIMFIFVLSLGLGWSAHLRVPWGWTHGVLAAVVAFVAMAIVLYVHTTYVAGTVNNILVIRCDALWPKCTEWAFRLVFGT